MASRNLSLAALPEYAAPLIISGPVKFSPIATCNVVMSATLPAMRCNLQFPEVKARCWDASLTRAPDPKIALYRVVCGVHQSLRAGSTSGSATRLVISKSGTVALHSCQSLQTGDTKRCCPGPT
eukprot:7322-Heterococcus_DN1.PRE.1